MHPIAVSKKGGIKMYEFKVGDEVYFSPYRTDAYIVIHGKIAKFEQSLDPERKYAVIYCDDGRSVKEYHIFPEDLYCTDQEVKEVLKQKFRFEVNEVKKNIHTLEDLLKFLYNNDVSVDEDDDDSVWKERVAVRELAREICGIELGE